MRTILMEITGNRPQVMDNEQNLRVPVGASEKIILWIGQMSGISSSSQERRRTGGVNVCTGPMCAPLYQNHNRGRYGILSQHTCPRRVLNNGSGIPALTPSRFFMADT